MSAKLPSQRRISPHEGQEGGSIGPASAAASFGWRNGCASPGEGVDSCRQRSQIGNPGKELLALRATRGAKCQDVRRQALYKIGEIEEKIQTLQAMQDALHRLVKECGSANVPVSDCPILESLGSNGTR